MRSIQRLWLILGGSFLLTSTASAQTMQQGSTSPHFNYGSIPWGTASGAVKSSLMQQGLAFVKVNEAGDLVFKGTLMDHTVLVTAIMAHDSLVKIGVDFITTDREARSFYHDMLGILTTKYGEPREKNELFATPYYAGDGFEDQAIKLGKALFIATWGVDEDQTETLWIRISDNLTVIVSYECPAFAVEANARKMKQARPF